MAQQQQPNVQFLITVGAVSGFLFLAMVIGVQAWFQHEVQVEIARKWDNTPIQPLTDERKAQLAKIDNYRWIDRSKDRVAIPIDQAMKIVAQGKFDTAWKKGS